MSAQLARINHYHSRLDLKNLLRNPRKQTEQKQIISSLGISSSIIGCVAVCNPGKDMLSRLDSGHLC